MAGLPGNVPRALPCLMAGLIGLGGAGCVRDPVTPPPVAAAPLEIEGAGPEGVVAEFMGLVRKDAMTADALERLVVVEQLAAGLQLEVGREQSLAVRHQQLIDALLLLLRGDGPMRRILAEGSFVYWGRSWDRRALVEVTQVVPPTMESVVHEVELQVVEGRWKISGFPEHPTEGPPRVRSKESR